MDTMKRLAMMVSRNRIDARLASAFGKAKWLLVHESGDRFEFRRNEGLSGRAVASAIASTGCRDVVAAHLGARAQEHLRALGIRVWKAREGAAAQEAIDAFVRGELEPWEPAGEGAPGCTPRSSGRSPHHPKGAATAGPADGIVRLGRKPR
jgi:predicted Fe-Mo cluster-binding NifX family protein